jgi:hypothetical protein
VKIPADFTIAPSKLNYLLRPRAKDDKSKFLVKLGFSEEQPAILELAIRATAAGIEAQLDRTTEFGRFYAVKCSLVGPQGGQVKVRIIVLHRLDDRWSFVTLYPDRE